MSWFRKRQEEPDYRKDEIERNNRSGLDRILMVHPGDNAAGSRWDLVLAIRELDARLWELEKKNV